jgi:membrane protease YdiL (CAAX protease family)
MKRRRRNKMMDSTHMNISNTQDSGQETSNPWKCWPTIGLSLAIGALAVVSQIIFAVIWVVSVVVRGGSFEADEIMENGGFLLACTLFSYPFVVGFTVLFIKLRKGNTLVDYLALRKTGIKPLLIWAGWTCGLLVLMNMLGSLFPQDPPEIMIALISNAHIGLVFITLVIVAPMVEELFFRGFMFKGISASRLGGAGAVVLSTLFWVAIHGFQYGWFPLVYLTFLGVILGMARLKTGSVFIPMILHAANNLLSVTMLKVMLDRGVL